jgi:hypothetical protein
MVHVLWIHVKYILNGVQNALVYIKCIGTSHKKTQTITKFVIKWK